MNKTFKKWNTTKSPTAAASPSQAWAILHRHARDEITPLRLHELCSDNDRVSSLVAVHTSNYNDHHRILLADMSRQRMTLETWNHLLRLATARDLRGFIKQLSWGQNDPDYPITNTNIDKEKRSRRVRVSDGTKLTSNFDNQNMRSSSPSMHLALRVPAKKGYEMLLKDGTNALDGIHLEWQKIQKYSECIRNGQIHGATGKHILDIVVVGNGVAIMALKFFYHALQKDKEGKQAITIMDKNKSTTITNATANGLLSGSSNKPISKRTRQMRFITSSDPLLTEQAIEGLNPETTMAVFIDIQGNESHSELSNRPLKNWLMQQKHIEKHYPSKQQRYEAISKHHMILITANIEKARRQYSKQMSFVIPEHSRCEPFTTFTSAGLVPLSIIFGWSMTETILAGAHDMDVHFTDTSPRHNLPILLALTDIWNATLFGSSSSGRVITPFSEVLREYIPFVAALESQTCAIYDQSNSLNKNRYHPGVIVKGSASGDYDRLLYQGEKIMPSELLAVMDTQAQNHTQSQQDAFMCSFFAHADVLAFGNQSNNSNSSAGGGIYSELNGQMSSEGVEIVNYRDSFFGQDTSMPFASSASNEMNLDSAEGNRPSTLLMCGRADAFTCGQLVALSEHRAVVSARILDVNPFPRNVGSSMRDAEIAKLRLRLSDIYEKVAKGSMGESSDEDEGVQDEKDKVNFATLTILTHYANRMHGQNQR